MIDFDAIRFPCNGEVHVKDGQVVLWEDCLVLGIFQQGSSVIASSSFENFWLVVTHEGETKKIHNLKNVRFDKHKLTT